MGGFNKKWNHMTDCYPEPIVEHGLQDAWEKAPVTMEACSVMRTWEETRPAIENFRWRGV